jgi:hypothetical protein
LRSVFQATAGKLYCESALRRCGKRNIVKVKDVVEVALLYVGAPAVTLYPLGFVGLFIQLWRDNSFPYYDFSMI